MKTIVSTTSTGIYVQKTVKAYNQKGYLIKFYTSLFDHKDSLFSKFFNSINFFNSIRSRRNIDSIPINLVEGLFFFELLRTMAARFGFSKTAHWIWERSEWVFDYWVSRKLAVNIDVIHGYEHVSLKSFKRAKALGIFCLYEQPSQHYSFFDKVYLEQIAKYQAFQNDKQQLLDRHTLRHVIARKDEELALADLIICNSTFSKSTLVAAGVDEKKIQMIPLGFPEVRNVASNKSGPFVILYAGTLCLRKGTHILLQTWKEHFENSDAELWLVGKHDLPGSFLQDLPKNVLLINNIPFQEMGNIYAAASVFVFPTLADGFGMVITEAMSQGLCVIATRNSAGPDLISDGQNGLLIDSNNMDDLRAALKKVIDNRSWASQLGANAQKTAELYTWNNYQKNLIDIVEQGYQEWKKA